MALIGFPSVFRPDPGLAVSISDEGSSTVVAVQGEADFATLPLLVDAFRDVISDHSGAVVVDLTQTRSIDTATIREVVRAERRLAVRGRTLLIRSPSALAARVLTVFGLSHLIEGRRRGTARLASVPTRAR